ncbi:MAG TPA: hypothetical protein P5509_02215, partial [Bacteroidales bacterium]|nr:hypothetical protein [Bacteroidales bacterium]
DNPLVIMCSNRSLKEHFLRKYNGICKCNLQINHEEICMRMSRECTISKDTMIQYRTLKSRILEIFITKENI